MRMEPSVWSVYFWGLDMPHVVTSFKKCGINISEFGDEHGAMLLEQFGSPAKIGAYMRGICDTAGFAFPQGHLWLKANICGADRRRTVDELKTWLEMYMEIGIPRGVLHTGRDPEKSPEENHAMRVEALQELTGFIGGADLTICLENVGSVPGSAGLRKLLDDVNSPHLGICLDTGHLNIYRDAEKNLIEDQGDFIRSFGHDRLLALHLADNDGTYDQHMMPCGRGNIDFASVAKALRAIDYTGILNYEIPGESRCPNEVREAKLVYLRTMHESIFGK